MAKSSRFGRHQIRAQPNHSWPWKNFENSRPKKQGLLSPAFFIEKNCLGRPGRNSVALSVKLYKLPNHIPYMTSGYFKGFSNGNFCDTDNGMFFCASFAFIKRFLINEEERGSLI
jgi:hypothetical protein